MNHPMMRALLVFSVLALLGGCVSVTTRDEQPIALPEPTPQLTEDSHYQAAIERGPEYIDALRAEPAPVRPIIVEGKNERGDQRELASKGFVRIGNGRFEVDDEGSLRDALDLGSQVGADQVWLYRQQQDAEREELSTRLLAAYYVRFKLLFGATFRNLTMGERDTLQLEGGVQIGSVVGGTPASQANLMSGDYVIAVNGAAVVDRKQFQEMLSQEAGKPVTLKVIRNQQRADRVVRLGAMPPVIKDP
ncbi:MAG: PDZ domain-containing protein [Xanthomonadales bacterium]|nr:PDZ domain-containing protein [Xanthomonadales bacterium]